MGLTSTMDSSTCCLQLATSTWDCAIFLGGDPGGLGWGGGASGNMAKGLISCSSEPFVFRNWKPLQPDNWYGHGLGGGEDCAHFSEDDGRWNDDVCQRLYRWICETELGKGS